VVLWHVVGFFLILGSTANNLCGIPPQYAPAPCDLAFDLLILKVVTESRVTWATSMPILVFLSLSVLDLGPMYATDVRQTHVRQHNRLMPRLGGGGIITLAGYGISGGER